MLSADRLRDLSGSVVIVGFPLVSRNTALFWLSRGTDQVARSLGTPPACVGIMRVAGGGYDLGSRDGGGGGHGPFATRTDEGVRSYLWLRRRRTGRKRPLFGADRFSPTAAFQEAFARRVFREIPSRPIACQRPPTANEQRVVGSTGEVRTGPATRLRSWWWSRADTSGGSYLLIVYGTHQDLSNWASG